MEDGKKAGQKLVVGEAVGMEAEGGGIRGRRGGGEEKDEGKEDRKHGRS